jgi:hypothetical protein
MQLRMPRATGGNLGRTKNIIHFVQAFVIFIAWAMTIAIWTKGNGIDGRTVWYWILVSSIVSSVEFVPMDPLQVKGGSRVGWTLQLTARVMQCWISLPALVYLAAVPMWPRARRFGNVYAFATVDIIYAVFWFSAWVALASYVAQGKSIGKSSSDDKTSSTKTTRATDNTKSGCDNWAYGSASKCKISTATTIIGVFVLYVDLFSYRLYLNHPQWLT